MHLLFTFNIKRLSALIVVIVLSGCTGVAPINTRVQQVQPNEGYRIPLLLKNNAKPNNAPNTLILMAFSGGGTRAAALSYGVLEELQRTMITHQGKSHRLIDEVDLITGVSGGSFTALSYALYGERLFTEFEPRFLKRDVQGDLIGRALNPKTWGKLGSAGYGRSEMAADYYDDILFHGATFDDLKNTNSPLAIVTGTDLTTGARFEFTQDSFDLLCSDLGKVRLARAVATSSAVPVVLSPVTYRNYGGNCGASHPEWVADITKGGAARPAGRAMLRYRDITTFEDSANRPYLHIVDGGVSDNLGLRGILETFEELEASPKFRKATNISQIQHIIVIVVNSRSAPTTNWNRSPNPPGFLAELLQSSSVPIDHFSYESVELLKDIAARWSNSRKLEVAERRLAGMTLQEADASVPKLTFNVIDVSFDSITDTKERDYFMNLPTSFSLPSEAVDNLRALGGRLFRESHVTRDALKILQTRP